MDSKQVPITVLTGYLGAGKTTVINHVLSNQNGFKVAVIVNDIGEVNIDASLIEKGNKVSQGDESLVPLSNGCICCTLRTDLIKQVAQLVMSHLYDYILIEASGICEPLPIAQSLTLIDSSLGNKRLPAICRLDTIATVVDAYRVSTEFSYGESLLHGDEFNEEDIVQLLIQQIEFCNVIVLNKTDMIDEKQLQQLEAILHKLQPSANIIRTNYGRIKPEDILNTHLFNFQEACLSPGWVQELKNEKSGHKETEQDEYGISSFVYYRKRPFNQKKLVAWSQNWPRNIVRCKGIVWLSSQNDTFFLFEQAGGTVDITPFGKWLAVGTRQDRENAFANDPKLEKEWDTQVGDRMVELVFIGLHLNKDEICTSLDKCLVSDKELSKSMGTPYKA